MKLQGRHAAAGPRSRRTPTAAPASVAPLDWPALDAELRPRLVAIGTHRFGLSREASEDAVQTVFLRVLTQRPSLRDVEAYFVVSFLNVCRDLVRWEGRRRDRQRPIEELTETPDPAAQSVERRRDVDAALSRLDGESRSLLVDYFVEGLSLAELAAREGHSQKTVWRRLHATFTSLRLELEDRSRRGQRTASRADRGQR